MLTFRFTLRQLLKHPGFSIVAILTLVFGIGASTVAFTVVNSVLLQPLTYRESGQLAVVWEHVKFLGPIGKRLGPNPLHVHLWEKRGSHFSGFSIVSQGTVGLTVGSEHPALTSALFASPNLLQTLQVQPILGRDFAAGEGEEGRAAVVIITYQLWHSLFRGDPSVLGRRLRLNGGTPVQIIGVLPENFRFPKKSVLPTMVAARESAELPEVSFIRPMIPNWKDIGWQGNYGNIVALARVRPGVTLTQAQAELNVLEKEVERSIPAKNRDFSPDALTATLEPMHEAVVSNARRALWLLMISVAALLLLACVNLANAQLGRALTRQRESAIRSALGASNRSLLLYGLSESLILSAVGGTAGVLLAINAVHFLRSMPINLPRLSEIAIDPWTVAFAFVCIAGSGLLAGILPALRNISADPQLVLQQNTTRSSLPRGAMRVRSWLIGLQVFGCTALLLLTALFVKDLSQLLNNNRGFDAARVAVAQVDPVSLRSKETRLAFFRDVLSNLRSIPGVVAAGLVSAMPLEGETWIDDLDPIGRPPSRPAPIANLRWVSPGYFETLGTRLVAGRLLNEADGKGNNAVISETAARLAWPGENALGRQFRNNATTFTVIGIVADMRVNDLRSAPTSMIYAPLETGRFQNASFVIRTGEDPASLLNAMRQAIWKRNRDVNIIRIKTLGGQVNDSLAVERFQTMILISFAAAALFLAALGIYGVLNYAVASRRSEIGIRMALGAVRQNIYALTVRQVATPIVIGFLGGWATSLVLTRYVASLLYGVKAVDASITLVIAALFLLAATAAVYLPARRAASIQPMDALRGD